MSQLGDVSMDRDLDTSTSVGCVETAESNSSSKPVKEAEEAKKGQEKCSSCVIDINTIDSLGENQSLCRICHLSAKEIGKTSLELSQLGCGCRGELGVAHLHCAEAWFRIRGNRMCEICGQTASNITGVTDNAFMEEWNENPSADTGSTSSNGTRRCLRGQPLCNLLMACLVIAFVLPWFFRVNMF